MCDRDVSLTRLRLLMDEAAHGAEADVASKADSWCVVAIDNRTRSSNFCSGHGRGYEEKKGDVLTNLDILILPASMCVIKKSRACESRFLDAILRQEAVLVAEFFPPA